MTFTVVTTPGDALNAGLELAEQIARGEAPEPAAVFVALGTGGTAAGLLALDTMVDRLAEDHANARTLAEGLAELPGIKCDLSRVQTNLIYFDLAKPTAAEFQEGCRTRGLLAEAVDRQRVRFVTHIGITVSDVQAALKICEEVLSA